MSDITKIEWTDLTPDQQARAAAALDAWWECDRAFCAGRPWNQYELREMHAALEAPDTLAALLVLGADPGTPASTPEQDAGNHATMSRIRQLLSHQADVSEAGAEPEAGPFPSPAFHYHAYGVDLTWIGDDGEMAALGHVPDLRFIAACNHMAREEAGLPNVTGDHNSTYRDVCKEIRRVWAVPCQPDGDDWRVTRIGITEDTPGAIPLTILEPWL